MRAGGQRRGATWKKEEECLLPRARFLTRTPPVHQSTALVAAQIRKVDLGRQLHAAYTEAKVRKRGRAGGREGARPPPQALADPSPLSRTPPRLLSFSLSLSPWRAESRPPPPRPTAWAMRRPMRRASWWPAWRPRWPGASAWRESRRGEGRGGDAFTSERVRPPPSLFHFSLHPLFHHNNHRARNAAEVAAARTAIARVKGDTVGGGGGGGGGEEGA